ncbi:endocuticle structural glycoprotein SgAbd-5 [Agrilus planipennis]|uniref:Endocuticle structural glycoprotein SgAbd-5 n=1 Tax=Agrilus planipennis TaxID=224129 RepID=A0A1W4W8T6_AGRPL|nr:endocuticle structural glycoprotein SgAbd-5 [Agrilus planipennis]
MSHLLVNAIKMKQVLVLFCSLWILALAKPQGSPDQSATILKYDNENIGVDGYKFDFETSNGISRNEEGTLKNGGSENEAIEVHGSYTYTDPKTNQKITVTFVADENGYKPQTSIA